MRYPTTVTGKKYLKECRTIFLQVAAYLHILPAIEQENETTSHLAVTAVRLNLAPLNYRV